jgi:hypothetical protein
MGKCVLLGKCLGRDHLLASDWFLRHASVCAVLCRVCCCGPQGQWNVKACRLPGCSRISSWVMVVLLPQAAVDIEGPAGGWLLRGLSPHVDVNNGLVSQAMSTVQH